MYIEDKLMLILTRRAGESIIIDDDIIITIVGIKGSQVRVGVNAPKDINVLIVILIKIRV